MSCSAILNCSDRDITKFDANPDVAGVGVVLAFLLSAWLTLLFVTLSYLFVESFPQSTMNRLDLLIIGYARKLKKIIRFLFPMRSGRTSFGAIQQIAMTLSDQQLIAGSCIFIVAYVQHCHIAQYHFGIIYLLGTASITTYQCTVIIVCHTLSRNRFSKLWRMIWIVAMFICVMLSNTLYYHDLFMAQYGLPTQCVWNNLGGDYYAPQSILWLMFTSAIYIWGLAVITRGLWPRTFHSCAQFLNSIFYKMTFLSFSKWYAMSAKRTAREKPYTIRFFLLWFVEKLAFMCFVLCFTLCEILRSDVVDILRNFATLANSTARIVDFRSLAFIIGMVGDEDSWEFGQILPLLLLALPFFQVLEMLYDEYQHRKRNDQQRQHDNDDQDFSRELSIRRIDCADPQMRRPSIIIPYRSDSNRISGLSGRDGKSLLDDDVPEQMLYNSVSFKVWMGICLTGACAALLWGAITQDFFL